MSLLLLLKYRQRRLTGSIAQELTKTSQSATGSQGPRGSSAQVLRPITLQLAGNQYFAGSISQLLSHVVITGAGQAVAPIQFIESDVEIVVHSAINLSVTVKDLY